jgi:DNA-binding NtrC family response regulator
MPDRAARPAPADTETATTPAVGRQTIVVAEDEPGVRRVAATILKRQGFTVLEAADGEDVLRVLQGAKGQVALVILDQRMPGPGTGATVTAIRALDPAVRVLLMSGLSEPEVAAEVRHLVRGFLGKPFRGGELLRAVEAALDGS